MRRAHRTAHFLLWLTIVLALFLAAMAAMHYQRAPVINDALPAALAGEVD